MLEKGLQRDCQGTLEMVKYDGQHDDGNYQCLGNTSKVRVSL